MVRPSPLPFCVAFACSPCACVGLLLLDLSRDIHIEEAALRTLKELHLCPCLSQILAAIYTAKALSSLEVMQWKLNLLESVQKRALRMITRSSATLLQLLSLQRREQAAIQLLKDMIQHPLHVLLSQSRADNIKRQRYHTHTQCRTNRLRAATLPTAIHQMVQHRVETHNKPWQRWIDVCMCLLSLHE